ncbi:thiamine pyrophosphate-dependent enzyme [Dactylosporangium sp. CA-092794]|uniref:thiamine pyrophosphate-dependent enzyme n=1 Tax=Dactylosporangium sp. CA-092794 TaxID=3239929 RepID=UPI003D8A86CF
MIGCKLGEIATKRYTLPGPGAVIVQLDIVAEEFGRTVQPDVLLWGDALLGVQDLRAGLEPAAAIGARLAPRAADVARRMARWWESVADRLHCDESPVSVARLMTESDLNYADIARSLGCHGVRVDHPAELGPALRQALRTPGPTVLDVAVTRDPAAMLPGVDNRARPVTAGDRIA